MGFRFEGNWYVSDGELAVALTAERDALKLKNGELVKIIDGLRVDVENLHREVEARDQLVGELQKELASTADWLLAQESVAAVKIGESIRAVLLPGIAGASVKRNGVTFTVNPDERATFRASDGHLCVRTSFVPCPICGTKD